MLLLKNLMVLGNFINFELKFFINKFILSFIMLGQN